ncbi:MAG: flagellar biosynthetic protein FliQ [Planctomycetota bacterium]|nr:MAG: flagellar biosynthetic protein FliQ [Planctomycetota bacterium]
MVLQIARQALLLVVLISGIPIVLSMMAGVIVSVFQAATQIQEQTLTFVPKMIMVFGSLAIGGYWMIAQLVRYTEGLFNLIPDISRGL